MIETVKIGKNSQRHLQKYKGSTEKDYIEFSRKTARKVIISRFDEELCQRIGVYNICHLAYYPTQMIDDTYISEGEFESFLIENSKNPYELAKLWLKLKADADNYIDKESILATYLAPFPKEDFERWGDINWLANVSKTWFKKDGTHLDVQIDEINSNPQIGIQLSFSDCIDFVQKFRINAYKNPIECTKNKVEERFKEISGFNIKEYYAEHLIKSCEFIKIYVDNVPF